MTFDIIGNIAIIQPLKGFGRKKIKALASKLLKQRNIETVYVKGKISGRLRIPKLTWVAGKRKSEVLHRESGCAIKLDIKKCYFSPRLGTDRQEIAKKVKKGEKVLVLFSGVAPYGIVIAKHSKAKAVWCIELSKVASRYAEENIKLNKLDNIKIIQGDVKRIIPKISKKLKFDSIVMARPQLKESFLREAFLASKKSSVIYFYDFLSRKEFPKAAILKINEAAKKARKKVKILRSKKVREIAPYKYHVRIDFKII